MTRYVAGILTGTGLGLWFLAAVLFVAEYPISQPTMTALVGLFLIALGVAENGASESRGEG